MLTSDPVATANWLLIYPDGRYISDEERHWSEVSVIQQYGRHTLAITCDPAASLAAQVAGRWHELKSPDHEGAHFFREYYDAARLGIDGQAGAPIRLRHTIGMICSFGRVIVDIDPRGFSKTRIELL